MNQLLEQTQIYNIAMQLKNDGYTVTGSGYSNPKHWTKHPLLRDLEFYNTARVKSKLTDLIYED